MARVLTLISGKGGSGKTTLGLSMAKLLSQCEKRVLLIDCDMSTHGATYFFERKLINDNITTTYDLFFNFNIAYKVLEHYFKPIPCSDFFDFIPSIKNISENYSNDYIEQSQFKQEFFFYIRENYDVIILDCQAGYSDLTKELIRVSDVSLFVLEADAVSASAMRVLHAKLFNEINIHKLQTFQIFNKVVGEEVEIYSSIKFGTFFTNIKPILFDLSVRKAFQSNMIPLINIENCDFTSDICQLTRTLFPIYADNIITFEIEVKKRALAINENIIKKYKRQKNRKLICICSFFSATIGLLAFFCYFTKSVVEIGFSNDEKIMLSFFIIMILFIIVAIITSSYITNNGIDKLKNEKEIEKNELQLLENQIYNDKNVKETQQN